MSRQIDRLVAEKVMGWVEGKHYVLKDASNGESTICIVRVIGTWDNDLPEWSPSTSISDAWTVVEQIIKSSRYDLSFKVKATRNDGYFAEISYTPSIDYEGGILTMKAILEQASTASEAICRAALKWVDTVSGLD